MRIPSLSFKSLEHYVKLPERFTIRQGLQYTGLSRNTFYRYLIGNWSNAKLIEREDDGSYIRINRSPNPVEIALQIQSSENIQLIGYGIPEGVLTKPIFRNTVI